MPPLYRSMAPLVCALMLLSWSAYGQGAEGVAADERDADGAGAAESTPADAEEPAPVPATVDDLTAEVWITEPAPETITVYGRRLDSAIDRSRPTDVVDRGQIERQQPQSTPDALVLSPGVFVQQTGHGQASPYIRGRTGQQVLILLDGLRLNHALFRKGPNQYLFTVDAHTIDRIEVVRGSASVELGSDALAGAILTQARVPTLDPGFDGLRISPQLTLRHRTADGEKLGRIELDTQLGERVGLLLGVGGRTVGRLQSGGDAWADGRAPQQQCVDALTVPCFEPDGRTQIGTGFDELTGDARLRVLIPDGEAHLAAYLYRQYDAPRTDQCPPPEQATGECLVYEEQFRTHVYGAVEHGPELALLDGWRAAFGFQRQHQRYRLTRPDRSPGDGIDTTTENLGRDGVDGFGGTFRAHSVRLRLTEALRLTVRYGADGAHEWIDSARWIRFADPPLTRARDRGQYVAGAAYSQAGGWLAPVLEWGDLRLRGGVRTSWINATSPGNADSASQAFDRQYVPTVLNAGLQWGGGVKLVANVEQGFRAPNLDDLTARQSTGQGYQIENPDLGPERALTLEGGLRLELPHFGGEVLAFRQTLDDAIERKLLARDDCTLAEGITDRECRANRAPVTLVNLDGTAEILGVDARLEWRPLTALTLRATAAWARGEGDNPGQGGPDRIPLSRISPLNGTLLAEWVDPESGLFVGGVLRWAAKQDRLSPGDVGDARIPPGGTPGFAVVDIWGGIEVTDRLLLTTKLHNLGDSLYRMHGSSLYGPGRGVTITLGYRTDLVP